jgi:hypothetical protein
MSESARVVIGLHKGYHAAGGVEHRRHRRQRLAELRRCALPTWHRVTRGRSIGSIGPDAKPPKPLATIPITQVHPFMDLGGPGT